MDACREVWHMQVRCLLIFVLSLVTESALAPFLTSLVSCAKVYILFIMLRL